MVESEPQFYYINTTEDSGVLNFLNEENWDGIIRRFGVRTSEDWNPQAVEIARGKPTDFVYFGRHLVCTELYWDRIFSILRPDLEGLELKLGNQKYILVNVFFNDNLLDIKRSILFRDPFTQEILNVTKFVFKDEVSSHPIFRISFASEYCIVSKLLADKILALRATGVQCRPIPEITIEGDSIVMKRHET